MAISPVASAEGRGVDAGLRRELGNWNFCFGRIFAVPGRCGRQVSCAILPSTPVSR
jgi:hypothetical protein